MKTIAILGSGVWGQALARAVSDSCYIRFWDRNYPVAEAATKQTPNAKTEKSIVDAADAVDLVIISVSSGGFSSVLKQLSKTLSAAPVVWLTKGFLPDTDRPLSTLAAELLGASGAYGVISGPSFASEVAAGLPTALVLAVNRQQDGPAIHQLLNRKNLRFYLEDDITGVEVGAAAKNIIAIAAGICDGMRLGDNARCALITRSLAEITTLGTALGGKRETFLGLSGVGDLTLTCSSDKSRNRRLGIAIGTTPDCRQSPASIANLAKETCEGLAAVASIQRLAVTLGIQTPIITATAGIINGTHTPAQAVDALLCRPPPI